MVFYLVNLHVEHWERIVFGKISHGLELITFWHPSPSEHKSGIVIHWVVSFIQDICICLVKTLFKQLWYSHFYLVNPYKEEHIDCEWKWYIRYNVVAFIQDRCLFKTNHLFRQLWYCDMCEWMKTLYCHAVKVNYIFVVDTQAPVSHGTGTIQQTYMSWWSDQPEHVCAVSQFVDSGSETWAGRH